jgi:hypothetical protein
MSETAPQQQRSRDNYPVGTARSGSTELVEVPSSFGVLVIKNEIKDLPIETAQRLHTNVLAEASGREPIDLTSNTRGVTSVFRARPRGNSEAIAAVT